MGGFVVAMLIFFIGLTFYTRHRKKQSISQMLRQDWLLQRYSDNGKSTQGLLFELAMGFNKPLWFAHALEDEHREQKVMNETRIPAAIYELKIRKEDTPLTIKHREVYNKGHKTPWFKYHIEIVGIPNFTGVYIHAGNKESHTSGCLLLNDTANNHLIEAGDMARSIQAVKRFYDKAYPHLESGKQAFIEIRNEQYLYAA